MDLRKRAFLRFISDISGAAVCQQILDFLFGDRPELGYQAAIKNGTGIDLTQEDFDRGLSQEQREWLLTNLDVEGFLKALISRL